MRKLVIVSEKPNTTKPQKEAESEKTMNPETYIVESLGLKTEIVQKQQVTTSISPTSQWNTNGQWYKVPGQGDVYVACYKGTLYKVEPEDDPSAYDLEFVLGDRPEIALYRYGTLVQSSGYDLPSELNRWQWEDEDPKTMQINYGAGWENVTENTVYDACQCREGLVAWSEDVLTVADLHRAQTLYEAWSNGYMWRVSVAENVQIGDDVTHFTITSEAIDALAWSHELGGIIFTPESWGYNEPDTPIQEMI